MSPEKEPAINLLADEQPTTCSLCGARTEFIEQKSDHEVERCLNVSCALLFDVYLNEGLVTRDFRTEKECIDADEGILVRYAGPEWLPSSTGDGGQRFVDTDRV